MKKLFTLIAMLALGISSTWADLTENTIVNCDFSNSETLFTDASRVTVQNNSTNENVEFVTAKNAANVWSGAKFDFSSKLDKGTKKVYVTFYCYFGDVTSGQFAVGDASKRTYTGVGAWGATTTGAIFTLGINRGKLGSSKTNTNNIRINGADLGADYNTYLTTWLKVELTADLENKKQSYTVTSGETTVASATDVAFADATATACDIIDFFTGTNSVTYYFDNLMVKDYYDASTTYYTATFTEGNGLDPNVTIYSDEAKTTEVTNGSLESGTTYYYKATLDGYQDYSGSFTVNGANPTVEYTMTAKPTYTVTVNAVDGSDNVITALTTIENVYDGKSISYYYPKYLTDDNGNVTYSRADFGKTTVAASSVTEKVTYTAYDGTAVYAEGEAKISATAVSNDNFSKGSAVRGFTSEKNVLTVNTAGIYDITYAVCSNNVNYDTYVYVYKNDTQIDEYNAKLSTNYIKTTGTRTISNVVLAADDVIKFKGGSTNLILDYVLATKIADGDAVASMSCAAGKMGTFCAPFDVTLPANIKAYSAKSTTDAVNLTKIADGGETLTAGTPAIIYNEGDAAVSETFYGINAFSGKTSCTADALTGLFTAGDVPANSYVLQTPKNGTQAFYKLSNSITGVANRCYVTADGSGAKLAVVFDGEDVPTAVAGVEAAGSAKAQPVKAIKNGRLVIETANGTFNAAGARIK